jgi:riboflavin kinase/FMN adenylyltransferase
MEVLRDPLGRDDPPQRAVVSIGNFDGVHIGHQKVISHAVARAQEIDAPSTIMTFNPHPISLLRPSEAPRLLTTIEQRLELLRHTGVDSVAVLPFTHYISRMSALTFIEKVLVERFHAREVFVGANFRFGEDREGDVDFLAFQGEKHGFTAQAWPTVEDDGELVSSTRIRAAVDAGKVDEAGRLLGRIFFGDGRVLLGKRLGRKLGFPTLNIEVENEQIPAEGVYLTAVHIPSFQRVFPSVTNIGVRPTVYENSGVTIESHLLDFMADVYQERVRLYFLKRLRDEEIFDSTFQLVSQVRRDVEAARLFFLNNPIEGLNLVHP